MDSAQSIALLQGGDLGPAATRHKLVLIRNMKRDLNIRFSFIHREGNKPAEKLMTRGIETNREETMDESTFPNLIRAMITLGRLGVPNVRDPHVDFG